jgi:amino acid transporter
MKPAVDHTGLAPGRLSLVGVLTQSIGFMGPVFSVAALLPLIVGSSATGRGAGIATPVAILIAGVGVYGVAWIIAQYAKRIHLCGSLSDYVRNSAGTRLGLVSGWLYYGAMLVLATATFLLIGGLTEEFLQTGVARDARAALPGEAPRPGLRPDRYQMLATINNGTTWKLLA